MNLLDDSLYKNIIENMSEGVLVIGFDGTIRMDNSIASEILEISPEELYQSSIAKLLENNSENDDFFECLLEAVYKKTKVNKTVKYHCLDKDKYLRLVISFLKFNEKEASLVVIINDITDLMELAENNRLLTERILQFLDNFVQVMITAIETRSPYNANHTRNMVEYASRFLDYMEVNGKLTDTENRAPFIASVWLHDIGKLVVPLDIMDKATRLGYSEKDVFHRIEIAKLAEELLLCKGKADAEEAAKYISKLEEVEEFIRSLNASGYASDETKEKVKEIKDIKCLTSTGDYVPLLNDYEYEALTVTRGTLTESERKVIESHASHTYDMLVKMGFAGSFGSVPEWASRHHEYLDGSGYPFGYKAEDLDWEVRFLTIIDIYDALTAEDRPYKKPIPPEKAFDILYKMCDEGKIDKSILDDFIASEAWRR